MVFALIGTLQFFSEPQILRPLSNDTITPDFTPNIYAFSQAFAYANFKYASAISFALGIVVFIAVYVFLFFTRKARATFDMTTTQLGSPAAASAAPVDGGRGPRTVESVLPYLFLGMFSSSTS